MPSYLFDPSLFSEIILTVHGHRDDEEIIFIEDDGHVTRLFHCRFDESFLGVTVGEDGTAYESRDPRAWALEHEIPVEDPMDCWLGVGTKRYVIQGSEINGVGERMLLLREVKAAEVPA